MSHEVEVNKFEDHFLLLIDDIKNTIASEENLSIKKLLRINSINENIEKLSGQLFKYEKERTVHNDDIERNNEKLKWLYNIYCNVCDGFNTKADHNILLGCMILVLCKAAASIYIGSNVKTQLERLCVIINSLRIIIDKYLQYTRHIPTQTDSNPNSATYACISNSFICLSISYHIKNELKVCNTCVDYMVDNKIFILLTVLYDGLCYSFLEDGDLMYTCIINTLDIYHTMYNLDVNWKKKHVKKLISSKQEVSYQTQWKRDYYGNDKVTVDDSHHNNGNITCVSNADFYEMMVRNIHDIHAGGGQSRQASNRFQKNENGITESTEQSGLDLNAMHLSYQSWQKYILLYTQEGSTQNYLKPGDMYRRGLMVQLENQNKIKLKESCFYLTNAVDMFLVRWNALHSRHHKQMSQILLHNISKYMKCAQATSSNFVEKLMKFNLKSLSNTPQLGSPIGVPVNNSDYENPQKGTRKRKLVSTSESSLSSNAGGDANVGNTTNWLCLLLLICRGKQGSIRQLCTHLRSIEAEYITAWKHRALVWSGNDSNERNEVNSSHCKYATSSKMELIHGHVNVFCLWSGVLAHGINDTTTDRNRITNLCEYLLHCCKQMRYWLDWIEQTTCEVHNEVPSEQDRYLIVCSLINMYGNAVLYVMLHRLEMLTGLCEQVMMDRERERDSDSESDIDTVMQSNTSEDESTTTANSTFRLDVEWNGDIKIVQDVFIAIIPLFTRIHAYNDSVSTKSDNDNKRTSVAIRIHPILLFYLELYVLPIPNKYQEIFYELWEVLSNMGLCLDSERWKRLKYISDQIKWLFEYKPSCYMNHSSGRIPNATQLSINAGCCCSDCKIWYWDTSMLHWWFGQLNITRVFRISNPCACTVASSFQSNGNCDNMSNYHRNVILQLFQGMLTEWSSPHLNMPNVHSYLKCIVSVPSMHDTTASSIYSNILETIAYMMKQSASLPLKQTPKRRMILPMDIYSHILSYCSYKLLCTCSCLNKSLYIMCHHNSYWKRLYMSRYGFEGKYYIHQTVLYEGDVRNGAIGNNINNSNCNVNMGNDAKHTSSIASGSENVRPNGSSALHRQISASQYMRHHMQYDYNTYKDLKKVVKQQNKHKGIKSSNSCQKQQGHNHLISNMPLNGNNLDMTVCRACYPHASDDSERDEEARYKYSKRNHFDAGNNKSTSKPIENMGSSSEDSPVEPHMCLDRYAVHDWKQLFKVC